MAHDKKDSDAEAVNKQVNAPEDRARIRAKGEAENAMTPASGAAVQHALAGAEIAAEKPMREQGETADALKRAAENDGRP